MVESESASNVSGDQPEAQHGEHGRHSAWQSTAETFDFVREALSDKSIVLRDEDRASSRVLSIFLLVGIAFIVVAAFQQDWNWLRTRLGAGGFTPFRPVNLIALACIDVLYFLPLCWFVGRRMGILRTMSKRHAIICCQLMIGASILTALICVNVAMLILLVSLGNQMKVLVG